MSPQMRIQALEGNHARRDDVLFRVIVRRNKLLGLWSASLLGLTDAAADAYASRLVEACLEEGGDDVVTRNILKDFKIRGAHIGERDIRGEMAKLYDIALSEISDPLACADSGNGAPATGTMG